ncbi:MAG: acyltransferase [Chloroflexi bacterium]|nr:acyltransferase [Chloroflexota bacterium]
MSPENKPKKLASIQALRAIAILLVMLFHLSIIDLKYGGGIALPPRPEFGYGGLDLFIVISGFITVTVTRKKFRSLNVVLNFLYDRATRVYPTYWFFTLLVLGVYIYNPSLVNAAQSNQIDIVASFLLLPDNLLPLVNVGWSLVNQIYFYLVFAVLLLVLAEEHLPWALLVWVFLTAIGELVGRITNLEQDATFALVTHPLNYEFVLGGFAAILFYSKPGRFGRIALVIGVVLYAVSVISMTVFSLPAGWFVWVRAPAYGLPAAFVAYGCVNLEFKKNISIPHWASHLGDASYALYLSHVPTMTLLGHIWAYFFAPNPLANVLILSGILCATTMVGGLSYRLIERPLIEKTRRFKRRLRLASA